MPVSHQYNCIFIHIPKTGGTTIERLLDVGRPSIKNYKNGNTTRVFHYFPSLDLDVQFSLQHLPAFIVRDLKHETFSNFYKFSFVRNPYDKIISEFCWVNRGDKKINAYLNNPDLIYSDFNDWVKYLPKAPSYDHLLQQHYFLYDNDQLLVDEVFKYEDFENNLKNLSKKLNFDYKDTHAYKRKFEVDKERMLTSTNKSRIYEVYAKDFEKFEYEK